MANFLTDNEDLQYYLQEGIDWEPLVALTELRLHGRRTAGKSSAEALAFYRDTAAMVGELVADEIAPHGAADRPRGRALRRTARPASRPRLRGHLPARSPSWGCTA